MTDNDVKQIILDVSGLGDPVDALDATASLSSLGFSDTMCSDLAEQLSTYINGQKPGASVNNDDISSDLTVQQVIDLVKQKI
jgi:hypothetical protein